VKEIEFLPFQHIQIRWLRYLRSVRAWLLVALVLVMVLWWCHMTRRIHKAHGELVAAHNVSMAISPDVQKVTRLDKERTLHGRHAKLIEELSNYVSPTAVLAELVRGRPPGILLSRQEIFVRQNEVQLSARPDTVSRRRAPSAHNKLSRDGGPAVTEVHLSGYAPDDVALVDYMHRLRRSGLFNKADLIVSKSTQFRGRRAQAFDIILTAVPLPSRRSTAPGMTTGFRVQGLGFRRQKSEIQPLNPIPETLYPNKKAAQEGAIP